MASDRVMMRCKTCGGWKCMISYAWGIGSSVGNDFQQWLESHANCRGADHKDLAGDPGYSLHMEDEILELPLELQNKSGASNA